MTPPADIFAPTRWTLVLHAARSDTTRARAALQDLCQAYWYPLYAYVRRRGYTPHDAEDLTQGFFTRLLKLESLARVAPGAGKFRAFLLASMNHFLSDERDHAHAAKRSAQHTISLDAALAENLYANEPADHATPERIFERRWALTLLENVVHRLQAEYETLGQGTLFDALRFAITGDKNAIPYAELALRLNLAEEALRVAVHRLRQRYRRLLRDEIAQTVPTEVAIEDELTCLKRILSS